MRFNRPNERRGIILLVVLALLTLFAIVGVAFVLYSDYEATAARVAREAEGQQKADVDPEQALAFFLGQLIYDVNDTVTGVGSGLRGHSLARTMYGYNPPAGPNANTLAFSGVGRLHYASALGQDDYTLVNYTWFASDGFLRDPERFGTRTDTSKAEGTYVAGNVPYTYPDLNNFYLAAVNAYGQVLTPSYHRKWLFNPNNNFNDMTNANWTNAAGKYLTLRPRPAEHPGFPIPDDAFGDVKNMLWTEGPNDSIWLDLGAPVMTAPDGTQYKMLFAPMIVDLDGRINLNTAGNILGGNTHVSNMGLGGWEVNLAKVLYNDQTAMNPPTEYTQIFTGSNLGASTIYGRYGANNTPAVPGANAISGTLFHSYAQSDVNGKNEAGGGPSSRVAPPGYGGTNTFCFPTFAQGYLNGGAEYTNHPLLFDVFRSPLFNGTDDRVFRASDLEALMRPNNNLSQPFNQRTPDSGSSALISDLLRLSPTNLGWNSNNPRTRNLVTVSTTDLGTPGVIPNWWNGMPAPSYLSINPNGALFAPFGSAVSFPTLPPNAGITFAPGTNSTPTSEFAPNWSAVSANSATYYQAANPPPVSYLSPSGRIQLNRPLPPYPHMGSGSFPPYQNQQSPNNPPSSPYGVAYNLTNGAVNGQYQAAVSARQSLANDIYRRLLALSGVAPVAPANLATPLPTDLAPRRWLAQLAVNIVDFIDEDDINTPFNFYTTQDTAGAPVNTNAVQGSDGATNPTGYNPSYWVYGTELPKVVLSEALAEAQNPDPTKAGVMGESVKVWLELFNTMPTQPSLGANTQQQDGYRVPLYMTNPNGNPYSPYRITIAQYLQNQPNLPNPPPPAVLPPVLPDASANVLGKSYDAPPFPQSTTDADFAAAVPMIGGGNQAAFTVPVSGNTVNAGVDPQAYFLIGPPAPGASYQDPFVPAPNAMTPGVPANTPTLRTASVTYTPTWTGASTTDERTTGLMVKLSRLANPYLPYNPFPLLPTGGPNPQYNANLPINPYLGVDFIQNVPIQSNAGLAAKPAAPAQYASRGKTQPYAALTQVPTPGGIPQAPAGSNALPTSTVFNQAVNPTPPPTAIVVPAGQITHSFGMANFPLPPSGHYDWLVHLDRPVISPIELLHVSAWPPYQLTQRFMLGPDAPLPANATNMFGHYAPWLDTPPAAINTMTMPWWFDGNLPAGSTHRLARLFEFFESGDRAVGVNGLGRIPGKVNINTVWDTEILQALIDANPSIGLPAMQSNRPPNPQDPIVNLFFNLMQSRSPNLQFNLANGLCAGQVGPVNMGTPNDDRPFLSLGVGATPGGAGTQFPNGIAVTTDTLLRLMPNTQLLFQNPGAPAAMPAIPADTSAVHPYLQTQLLTKLYNNVTTRSNTFAVFLTVGFFRVSGTVTGTTIPQLWEEIGRSEGRQIRHRMFAIIDRTNLTLGSTTYTGGAVAPSTAAQAVSFAATGGANPYTGANWSIAAGTNVVFEPGTDNEETVLIQAGPMGALQATFFKTHGTGATVAIRGNPGPWGRYDPKLDPYVVPYYSIID